MKFRAAKSSDRDEILSFCVNTFSWGDYIDRVWDYWLRTGRLFVAEGGGKKVAMSHVSVCPDNKSAWLEGVRVRPEYRRSKIATRLMERMLKYSRKSGALQACAIVEVTNAASQRMVEKNGFEVVSRWDYYSTKRARRKKSTARIATIADLPVIWRYLQESEIYRLSAKRYVKSWHWYALDRYALRGFVKDESVIMAGDPIAGVALVNKHGYWDRKSIMQVAYLDALSKDAVRQLISLATNLYLDGGFSKLQIVCHDSRMLTSVIEKSMIKDEEQFLLYSRAL